MQAAGVTGAEVGVVGMANGRGQGEERAERGPRKQRDARDVDILIGM